MKRILIITTSLLISCNLLKNNSSLEDLNNKANNTLTVMKGYQPIDPIQVKVETKSDSLISEFPNEATRIAIGKINQNGSLTFSSLNVAKNGESYSVIVDYIKYITTAIPAKYTESQNIFSFNDYTSPSRPNAAAITNHEKSGGLVYIPDKGQPPNILVKKYKFSTNYGTVEQSSSENTKVSSLFRSDQYFSHVVRIPIYVGVGLRIQASVTVLKDSVNLGSLYGLGVAASQNKLSGTLIVQSLGISGENISPIIPIPDRINESTIQAAMQALATIKSKLYDNKTKIIPQVVAFGLPYGIIGAKDLIESSLNTSPPYLEIKCNQQINLMQENYNNKYDPEDVIPLPINQ